MSQHYCSEIVLSKTMTSMNESTHFWDYIEQNTEKQQRCLKATNKNYLIYANTRR